MNEQQYIEHEVQIRVLKETTDSRFTLMQKNFDDKFSLIQKNIDDKISIIIGIGVVAILVPLLKLAFEVFLGISK